MFTSAMPGVARPGMTLPALLVFDEGVVGGFPPIGLAFAGGPLGGASLGSPSGTAGQAPGSSATALRMGPAGTVSRPRPENRG